MTKPASEPGGSAGRRQEKQRRTCRGCGLVKRQDELWALALSESGRVVPDEKRRRPGRHVYCCRTAACLERLQKNGKRIARAFRAEAVEFDEGLQSLFGSVVA